MSNYNAKAQKGTTIVLIIIIVGVIATILYVLSLGKTDSNPPTDTVNVETQLPQEEGAPVTEIRASE